MKRGHVIIHSTCRASLRLIRSIIEQATPHIICCSTIEQTITACSNEEPHMVIILGVRPFINGQEIVSHIRMRGSRHPVIYVIAWQQAEQIVLSLLECGVDQYLTLPISISRLQSKVEGELKTSARL